MRSHVSYLCKPFGQQKENTAVLLVGFGLLTLFLSTSVIFDLFGIRAKEGN